MTAIAETAELAWGYTMADLERCARVAVHKTQWQAGSLDYDDRKDAAWHAIVVELYGRTDPPHFRELLLAGMGAIGDEVTQQRRHHGRRSDMPDGISPSFKAYWLPVYRQKHYTDDGFSDRLCEAIALRDALSVLTADQYEALATLAVFNNDFAAAAEALGLKYHCFYYRVLSGRKKIKAVWLGDETPVTSLPTGETCRVGHSRSEYGKYRPDTGTWTCRRCNNATARRRAARKR